MKELEPLEGLGFSLSALDFLLLINFNVKKKRVLIWLMNFHEQQSKLILTGTIVKAPVLMEFVLCCRNKTEKNWKESQEREALGRQMLPGYFRLMVQDLFEEV